VADSIEKEKQTEGGEIWRGSRPDRVVLPSRGDQLGEKERGLPGGEEEGNLQTCLRYLKHGPSRTEDNFIGDLQLKVGVMGGARPMKKSCEKPAHTVGRPSRKGGAAGVGGKTGEKLRLKKEGMH